jgi:hypothetical protein
MHRETLVLKEKVLGKEHPSTLISTDWLAYLSHRLPVHRSSRVMPTGAERTNRTAGPKSSTNSCVS